MTEVLHYERKGHAAWLTLNRPELLNALSRELKRAIVATAMDVSTDPEVWVVVLRGAGGRAFCVGADLKEMREGDDQGTPYRSPMFDAERNVYEAVLEIPKPTIAVVDGFALGGGFELALACDMRVASDDAVFGLPESTLGMGANFGSVLLPRLLPRALALEMLYFGRRMSAAHLFDRGLINEVWPKAEVHERAEEWVQELLQRAPLTLQRYKQMALKGWDIPVSANLRLDVGPNPYTSQDRLEGTQAFRDKRAPRWEGR